LRGSSAVAAVSLFILSSLGPARASDPGSASGLASLLAGFAAMPGLSARFHEEKRLPLLVEPLVTEGTLLFSPPDRLLRRVETPVRSSLLLAGDELVIDDGRSERSLALDTYPMVRAFVDSFRLLLAGDLPGLTRLYDVAFEPGAEGWSLALAPRAAPLKDAIREIAVRGKGQQLLELTVRDLRGGETRTRFSQIDPARRFSPEERASLFRAGGP
jgi:hypothetical protein